MIEFEDDDFETSIRNALAADPKMAERVVNLMNHGAKEIERFEAAILTVRKANTFTTVVSLALDEAVSAFSNLIEIFNELMIIATGR